MGYGGRPGCSGRSSCRWRCPPSWPACGSPRSPPSRWSPSGVIVGHGGLGQLIIGGFNANFYRAEIVTGALGCVLLALVRRPAAGRRGAAADAVGPGGARRERLRRRLPLPQRPVQLDPAERHPRPARRAPADLRWSPCWPRWSSPCRSACWLGTTGRGGGRDRRAAPTSPAPSRPWRCSRSSPSAPIGFGDRATDDRAGRLRHPADPDQHLRRASAGSTATSVEAARAMGMSRAAGRAPRRAAAGRCR